MKITILKKLTISILCISILSSCTSNIKNTISEEDSFDTTDITEEAINSAEINSTTQGNILNKGSISMSLGGNDNSSVSFSIRNLDSILSSAIDVSIESETSIEVESTIEPSPLSSTDEWTNLEGNLLFTIFSNDTLSYDSLQFQILIENGGLTGEIDESFIIPIELIKEDNTFLELSDEYASVFNYEETSILDETISFEIDVNSFNMPSQPYSGTISYQLVGISNNPTEVHGISVYQSDESHSSAGEINVNVDRNEKSVILILSSYEEMNWVVTVEDETTIEAVYLYGYETQTVEGVSNALIVNMDYFGTSYSTTSSTFLALVDEIYNETGLTFSSFQGEYEGDSFNISTVEIQDVFSIKTTTDLPELEYELVIDNKFVPFNNEGPIESNEYTSLPLDLNSRYAYAGNEVYIDAQEFATTPSKDFFIYTTWHTEVDYGSVNASGNIEESETYTINWIADITYDTESELFYAVSSHVYSYLYSYSQESNTWTTLADLGREYRYSTIVYDTNSNSFFGFVEDYSNSNNTYQLNQFDTEGIISSSYSITGDDFSDNFEIANLLIDKNGHLILFLNNEIVYYIDLEIEKATVIYNVEN
jgi:hypothetical protein